MYRADTSHDGLQRDSRSDPRSPKDGAGEVVVDRKSIIADRSREDDSPWHEVRGDRRRSERRRIERMGTDI